MIKIEMKIILIILTITMITAKSKGTADDMFVVEKASLDVQLNPITVLKIVGGVKIIL